MSESIALNKNFDTSFQVLISFVVLFKFSSAITPCGVKGRVCLYTYFYMSEVCESTVKSTSFKSLGTSFL